MGDVDHAPLPQLELDAQLCFPLYAATRAVSRRYARLLAGTGLTYPQYLTLLALWGAEGGGGEGPQALSVGELGSRLRLDSGTLTPVLKRLEAMQLVVRRRDPADERRVLIGVTEEGWRLRSRVADVPASLAAATGMTSDEGRRLRDQLTRVIAALDAADQI